VVVRVLKEKKKIKIKKTSDVKDQVYARLKFFFFKLKNKKYVNLIYLFCIFFFLKNLFKKLRVFSKLENKR